MPPPAGSKSVFGLMWPWPWSLTYWPQRWPFYACPCPVDYLFQFASKSVHSFLQYRVHNFGSRWTNEHTHGRTNERTERKHNASSLLPFPFSLLARSRTRDLSGANRSRSASAASGLQPIAAYLIRVIIKNSEFLRSKHARMAQTRDYSWLQAGFPGLGYESLWARVCKLVSKKLLG